MPIPWASEVLHINAKLYYWKEEVHLPNKDKLGVTDPGIYVFAGTLSFSFLGLLISKFLHKSFENLSYPSLDFRDTS